ncbi:hypothetical protein EBZ39_18315 [bacterium]|jgi:hypothetical protein|nr:hypothetical protein [bacterium]
MTKKTRTEPMYHDTLENRRTVIDICASSSGLTTEQLQSKCRERKYTLARAVAAKILRERMHLTLMQTGACLGHPNAPKHYSSVLHLLSMMDDLLYIKDDHALNLFTDVNFRLAKAMTHGTRVLVYIPDGDDGQLLRYLTDQDYRHEIVE